MRPLLIEIIDALIGGLGTIVHDLLGQNGLLLRKTVLLRRGLHKQEIIRLGDGLCHAKIVPRLLLLFRALAKRCDERQQSLTTTRAIRVGLLNPELGHGDIILPDVARRDHLVRLPDFLIPTTSRNATGVPLNGLIQLAHILQGLRQLEHVANIVRLILQSLSQQPNIALLLIGLGPSISNIIDPHPIHLVTIAPVPILVGDAHTLPGHRKLHKAGVVVLESTVLLDDAIAAGSLQLGMRILTLKNHISVQDECLGLIQIPSELLGLLIGCRKRQATVVPKVLPLVLDDLRGTLLEIFGNLASMIRRTRIADDDSICVTSASLQASLEDLALILDHQGQQEVRHVL